MDSEGAILVDFGNRFLRHASRPIFFSWFLWYSMPKTFEENLGEANYPSKKGRIIFWSYTSYVTAYEG